MKSKLKLFLENFLFYGGLSILQKALPFLTLPIIAKLLPDSSSYGILDMFNLIISFGSALGVLGMYDAIFREYFEKKEDEEYKKKVVSTGLGVVLVSSIFVIILIFIFKNKITIYLFNNIKYQGMVSLSALGIGIGSLNTIISAPTRMKNQRKIFFATGIIFPVIGFLLTYYFIKKGYTYEALIYGTILMSLISLITFFILNRKEFSLLKMSNSIAKELLKVGVPLLPTFLIFWVFNSMDRIMINKMLGARELGVYSIGAKVASISQLVYMAFSGGWAYFKFYTMKDNDQVKINSMIFEYLGIISFLVFIGAQPFVTFVFNKFFIGDYQRGAEVFLYLLLSPLILMLFQIIGSQLTVIKKTYYITLSLILGALLNVTLNYCFIQIYGIKGAAFSTVVSYIFSTIVIGIICMKFKLLEIKMRMVLISLSILIIVISSMFMSGSKNLNIIFSVLVVIEIIIFYFKDVKNFFKILRRKNEV